MERLIPASRKRPAGPISYSPTIRPTLPLRFKKLAGHERIWSVRINDSFRALAERDGDKVVWFWIGSHNEFDKLFG